MASVAYHQCMPMSKRSERPGQTTTQREAHQQVNNPLHDMPVPDHTIAPEIQSRKDSKPGTHVLATTGAYQQLP